MRRAGLWLSALVLAGLVFGHGTRAQPVAAQPPPPPPTPGVPAGPPIDLAGRWSITRTYWRSCPHCSSPVIRTVPWVITQAGADVRVDRGPRGSVLGSGPAYLTLEGIESEGFSVLRLWYATLFVSADGNFFEGAFNGSERSGNPCGDDPPEVTCFVSAGWIRGLRVDPIATAPAPPGPPTPMPTATETPRPFVAPPGPGPGPAPGEPTSTDVAPPLTRPVVLALPWVSAP